MIDFLEWAGRLRGAAWLTRRKNRLWRNACETAPIKLLPYFDPDLQLEVGMDVG